MDGTPRNTTVLLRRGAYSKPGRFERLVRELVAQSGHLDFQWCLPDPDAGPGSAFIRDNEMVAKADLVLAFFDPQNVMQGGTAHVVETAVDRSVPVYSYSMEEDALVRVGDHDPEALWQETLEAFF